MAVAVTHTSKTPPLGGWLLRYVSISQPLVQNSQIILVKILYRSQVRVRVILGSGLKVQSSFRTHTIVVSNIPVRSLVGWHRVFKLVAPACTKPQYSRRSSLIQESFTAYHVSCILIQRSKTANLYQAAIVWWLASLHADCHDKHICFSVTASSRSASDNVHLRRCTDLQGLSSLISMCTTLPVSLAMLASNVGFWWAWPCPVCSHTGSPMLVTIVIQESISVVEIGTIRASDIHLFQWSCNLGWCSALFFNLLAMLVDQSLWTCYSINDRANMCRNHADSVLPALESCWTAALNSSWTAANCTRFRTKKCYWLWMSQTYMSRKWETSR